MLKGKYSFWERVENFLVNWEAKLKEIRLRKKIVMVLVVVLYGLYYLSVSWGISEINFSKFATTGRQPSAVMGFLWAAFFLIPFALYLFSIPLLFFLRRIGRFLIISSSIIFNTPVIIMIIIDLIAKPPLLIKWHIIVNIVVSIIIGYLPVYYFTRPKVKEQFQCKST